jgi:hypothetical protein
MHGDGGEVRTAIDKALVRTPNFAPYGWYPPAETRVRTAVGCHLLARRKSESGSSPIEPPEPMGGAPPPIGRGATMIMLSVTPASKSMVLVCV